MTNTNWLDYYNNLIKKINWIISFQLEKELNLLKYKMIFIKFVLSKKIIIEKQNKENIVIKLEELKFPKLNENNSYDYLLNIPLFSLNLEKNGEFKNKGGNKEDEWNLLNSTSEKQIWKKELDE